MADKQNINFLNELIKLQKQYHDALNSALDINEKLKIQEDAIANQKRIQVEQERLVNESKIGVLKLSKDEKKELNDILNVQKNITTQVQNESTTRKILIGTLNSYKSALMGSLNFLMQSDKAIKSTALNLGLSGVKANDMRLSFEQSAGLMVRLGGTIEDIGKIQQAYTDETGRATALSGEMLKNITLIGKGTGLGVEQASKLVGQFNNMGVSASAAMDYVQGVLDSSERMGVNSTKVLKNISDNFKKLNTYNFQQGTKGFAQMAMYAEKMKINMNDALNAADIAKSLEGAIDLTAQLQIMGGEFAKTDPFEMLFLSRNDPAKFTEKIADMTKGVVTFRKTADGSFEKFISPADRDRLSAVAKSLGMEASALTEIAQKQADIQKMRQQMAGMGLSGKEKELIEAAGIMNKETGKFEVSLAGRMRDISTLTKDQASAFVSESASLAKRAEEAQTFEEVFNATLMELKSALLPILREVNKVLTWARPYIIKFTEAITSGPAGWMKVIGAFGITVLAWKTASGVFSKGVDRLTSGIANKVFGGGKSIASNAGESILPEKGTATKGAGGRAFGKGAGIGAAAIGIGAGVGLAAEGISKLADSMSKLTPKQAEVLNEVVTTLAWFMGISVGLVAAVALFGGVAGASAGPLIAFGAAVALIGVGVGVAAVGIGEMSKGLAVLIDTGSKAGTSMFTLAGGMAGIAGSLLLFTAGSLGLITFGATMMMIAKSADGISRVGEAFKQINAVMSGSREDYAAVAASINSIANANVKGGGIFTELSKMLKSPLKVEFADKQVAVVSNITLNIDGQKFHEITNTGAYVRNKTKEGREGLTGNG